MYWYARTISKTSISKRKFRANYLLSARQAAVLWNMIVMRGHVVVFKLKPYHLLWHLYWLKAYPTYDRAATHFKLGSRDTFSKWNDIMEACVGEMPLVRVNCEIVSCDHDDILCGTNTTFVCRWSGKIGSRTHREKTNWHMYLWMVLTCQSTKRMFSIPICGATS